MVRGLIAETYAKFKEVVASGREQAHQRNKNSKEKGQALSEDWTTYADGRVLTGTEAFRRGFVDELGDFEAAFKRARTVVGISKANLVEYQQHYDLSDLFRLFGKTEARVVKVDVGLETPKLKAGQLYFLSPILAP
jgi:protease-4